jgi:hypothetical protein
MNLYSYKVNGLKKQIQQKNAQCALKFVSFQISLRTTLWSNKIKNCPTLATTILLILITLNRQ